MYTTFFKAKLNYKKGMNKQFNDWESYTAEMG